MLIYLNYKCQKSVYNNGKNGDILSTRNAFFNLRQFNWPIYVCQTVKFSKEYRWMFYFGKLIFFIILCHSCTFK